MSTNAHQHSGSVAPYMDQFHERPDWRKYTDITIKYIIYMAHVAEHNY